MKSKKKVLQQVDEDLKAGRINESELLEEQARALFTSGYVEESLEVRARAEKLKEYQNKKKERS
jgi:hypothetical protein